MFFLPSIPIVFNVDSSIFKTLKIVLLNDEGFPDSNRKPVFSSSIVSLEPPILLAMIIYSIDCASTATRPKASGSIDDDMIISETL